MNFFLTNWQKSKSEKKNLSGVWGVGEGLVRQKRRVSEVYEQMFQMALLLFKDNNYVK